MWASNDLIWTSADSNNVVLFNSTNTMSIVNVNEDNGTSFYSSFSFHAFRLQNQSEQVVWFHCDVILDYCTDTCLSSRLGINQG